MRFLLLLISLMVFLDSFLYWEDMTEKQQWEVLHLPEVGPVVKAYAANPWEVSDDEKSFSLLTELTSTCDDPYIQALYFYQFNCILTKADGALGEAIPDYVMLLVDRDPEYAFKYLQLHKEMYDCYVFMLACYFYYNDDANIKDCEVQMKHRCPKSMSSWISSFYSDIRLNNESVGDSEPLLLDPVVLKPTFDGGDINDFSRWVYEHLNYPEEAKKNGISGRVKVSFTVSEEGKLTTVKVLESLHPLLDQEAVRVIQSAPDKWMPGRMTGRGEPVPISVSFTFPIIFRQSEE